MQKFEELLVSLEKASGKNKFPILNKVIRYCCQNNNHQVFVYFDQLTAQLEEYLYTKAEVSKDVKAAFSASLLLVFSYIQKLSDVNLFEKYYPYYSQFEDLLNDPVEKAKLYQAFGYLFWLKQDSQQAIFSLEQSLQLINQHGKVSDLPNRYTNLGYIYEFRGDFNRAENYYQAGLNFAQRHNSHQALQMAFAALGRLNMSQQRYHAAIEFFLKTLELYDEDPHDMNRLILINNLATSYAKTGDNAKAIAHFKELKSTWLEQENPEFFFSCLTNMAISLINLQEYEKAKQNLYAAEKYAKQNRAQQLLFGCEVNLGIVFQKLQQEEQALDYFEKAMQIAEKANNDSQRNACFKYIADIYQKRQEHKLAVYFYEKASELSQQQDNDNFLQQILPKLGKSYQALGRTEEAYKAMKLGWESRYRLDKAEKNKQQELATNKTVQSGRSNQYIFTEGISAISLELSQKIGMPIIGKSAAIQKVIQQTYLASAHPDASVLLLGESGTGKELIAKLIHQASLRHHSPFVAVNSASFSSGLVQSTLFGHKKGAFTGASSDHVGYFEKADKGTIFFDEIADMPLTIQSQILRVLEQKSIMPLGSNQKKQIDFRLICATHLDIYEKVKNNGFRFDLINRINTLEIHLPPLRQRAEDIPLLIDYFTEDISQKLNKAKPEISRPVFKLLCEYDYPGNVRELKNMLEKLILFCKNNKITKADLDLMIPQQKVPITRQQFKSLNLRENEIALIKQALKEADQVKTKAAKLLGITPYSLLRRLKKYDL